MNANVQQEQNQIVMISVECSMFGGYKRSNEQDIIDAGGQVPDTDVLTKGGKRIFPSERLAAFGTVKKNALRELWKFGVKSLGSGSVLAFNAEHLPEAERIMDGAKAEFDTLLNDLKANYNQWLNDYIQIQPNTAAGDIIRRAALTMEDATSRFSFNYDTFMPTPVGKNGSVESMAAKLSSQLYKEVSQAAYEAYDKSFNPVVNKTTGERQRRKVGQKAKSPIRTCRDKLFKLSFLNPSITGAITIIDSVLATTQVTGWIEDTPSNPADTRLYGLVQLMADADKFANAATTIMQSIDVDGDVNALCGVERAVDDSTSNLFANEEEEGAEEDASLVAQVVPVVAAQAVAQTATKPKPNFEANFF